MAVILSMSLIRKHTTLVLHPAAQVLARGDGAVQFGLDASRAGILVTTHARALIRVLRKLTRPVSHRSLRARLKSAGCTDDEADNLIEELLAYGILQVSRAAAVAVIGESPLSVATIGLLHDAGLTVRRPLDVEEEAEMIADPTQNCPLVIVDRPAVDVEFSLALHRYRPTTVTSTLLDGRGFIGPVRTGGVGPCPTCVQLHWIDHDEFYYLVTSALVSDDGGRQLRQDPVAVAATAAATAALVAHLSGFAYGPYALSPPPHPGLSLVVDPYAPETGHRFTLQPHPGCPACFEAVSQPPVRRAA